MEVAEKAVCLLVHHSPGFLGGRGQFWFAKAKRHKKDREGADGSGSGEGDKLKVLRVFKVFKHVSQKAKQLRFPQPPGSKCCLRWSCSCCGSPWATSHGGCWKDMTQHLLQVNKCENKKLG